MAFIAYVEYDLLFTTRISVYVYCISKYLWAHLGSFWQKQRDIENNENKTEQKNKKIWNSFVKI